MSQVVASLVANIGADTKGFEKGAAGVKSNLLGLAGQFLSTAAVIGAMEEALRYSVNAAAEAEAVDAKLASVIASTGGAAGMTASEIDGMATSLSRMSTFDDEAIKSSSALLLTFTQIGQEVFPQAQQAVLDMSTALGTDLQSSTIQLGKALNDPVKGMTALTKAGVSFTSEQKTMIKTLVDSGDVMGAQKLILQELSTEFGGQALAASKTYAGQMAQLKTEFGNVAEEIGGALIPALHNMSSAMLQNMDDYKTFQQQQGDLAEFMNYPISTMIKWAGETDKASDSMQENTVIVGRFGTTVQDVNSTLENNNQVAANMANNYTAWAMSIGQVGAEIPLTTEQLVAQDEALKELSKTNADTISGAIELTQAHEDYKNSLLDINTQIQELQAEKENLYPWEIEKIQELEEKQAELREEYRMTVEEFKAGMEEKLAMMAIEKIAMQDGVAGYSEAEMAKAEAVLKTMDVVTGAAINEQLAMEKLTGAVATGAITVEEFGSIIDQAMADGVISVDEITTALNGIPRNIPINVSVTTTGMEGLSALGASLAKQSAANPGRTYAQGGRAGGGYVTAGASYLVGESGIETFTPSQNGNITPNKDLGGGMETAAMIAASIPSATDIARALSRELMKMGIGSNR